MGLDLGSVLGGGGGSSSSANTLQAGKDLIKAQGKAAVTNTSNDNSTRVGGDIGLTGENAVDLSRAVIDASSEAMRNLNQATVTLLSAMSTQQGEFTQNALNAVNSLSTTQAANANNVMAAAAALADKEAPATLGGFNYKTAMYIGGGVLALFLLVKLLTGKAL